MSLNEKIVIWEKMRTFLANKIREALIRLFSLFGIGIYRLNSNTKAQGFAIRSAIDHNRKERINEFYADLDTVKAYLSPERLRFYEQVVRLLPERGVDYRNKRVADVGCGTGHLLRCIYDNHNPLSLTGLEYSEAALDIAKTVLPGATFRGFDIYEGITLKFDVVFCVEVLEHLLFPASALKNLLDLVDGGGVAVATVPNGRADTYEGHINFWSPESWQVFVRDICSTFDVETGLIDGNTNFAVIKHNVRV
jgi:2-polyprenyl-3-methyl-5-hydroxy-6-metoxy-1,4-benzoquinol methylase